jgi:glycosyltransferase 2 family protein
MKKLKRSLSLVFFLVGVILLIMLIRNVGFDNVLATFSNLGWKILYVLVFPIVWYSIQSAAWWRIITDDGHSMSYWHVLLAKLTGEAINTITPVNFVGGDPYRIYLLQKKLSKTNSTASVVIDRTMSTLAVILLLFTALVAAWFYLPLPGQWRIFFPIFTAGFFVFFLALVLFQKKGMFTTISRLLHRLGIQRQRIEAWSEKIEQTDHQVRGFYQKHKLHFFEIMLLHYIGRLLGAVEIYIIVSLLGLPVEIVHCLFLSSLTVLINMMFVFIPGSMGVMESGYGGLFYLLKLNPAYGVGIQLVRRVRTIFWISIGLIIMLAYQPKTTEAPG